MQRDRQCSAIGKAAEFTFNPKAPGSVVPVAIAPGVPLAPPFLVRIDCPSVRQCTAVGWKGTEITFDPIRPGTLTAPAIAPESSMLDWLSCPSVSQCTAVTGGEAQASALTFDPASLQTRLAVSSNAAAGPIACPSVAQCTILYSDGGEATFNPTTSGTLLQRPLPLEQKPFAGDVACVSEHQCTATGASTDGRAHEVTFDPVGSGQAPKVLASGVLPGGASLACPAATQCTVLRETFEPTASDTAFTFDPQTAPAPTAISLGTRGTIHLACPSINQCTTVDIEGRETTFDPNSPSKPAISVVIDRLAGGLASITHVGVSATRVAVAVRCVGVYSECPIELRLLVHETLKRGRVIAVGARSRASTPSRRVAVRTVMLARVKVPSATAGIIHLALNAVGRRLLAARRRLPVTLVLTQSGVPAMRQVLLFRSKPAH